MGGMVPKNRFSFVIEACVLRRYWSWGSCGINIEPGGTGEAARGEVADEVAETGLRSMPSGVSRLPSVLGKASFPTPALRLLESACAAC